jgi:hypothetical protein
MLQEEVCVFVEIAVIRYLQCAFPSADMAKKHLPCSGVFGTRQRCRNTAVCVFLVVNQWMLLIFIKTRNKVLQVYATYGHAIHHSGNKQPTPPEDLHQFYNSISVVAGISDNIIRQEFHQNLKKLDPYDIDPTVKI